MMGIGGGDMADYLVLDFETDDTHSCNKKVNPLDPSSSIRLIQYKKPGENAQVRDIGKRDLYYDKMLEAKLMPQILSTKLLIGHNIKYDLSFIWKYKWFQQWLIDGGKIFDTAQAEYLLSGQYSKYPSLNYCAQKYGGTPKEGIISDLLNNNVTSSEILEITDERLQELYPFDKNHQVTINKLKCDTLPTAEEVRKIFIEYAFADVINTEIVYRAQMQQIKQIPNMLPMMEVFMDHILATLEMEYNGLSIKHSHLKNLQERHARWTQRLYNNAKSELALYLPTTIDANPDSDDHVRLALYGGEVKYKTKEVQRDINGTPVRFKSGKTPGEIRYKIVDKSLRVEGLGLHAKEKNKRGKKGLYSVDKSVLKELVNTEKRESVRTLAHKLLRYWKNSKIQSTYLEGYLKYNSTWDNCIRPSFNTVSTATGRLSCSQPNFQNTHPAVIKHFVPRNENWSMAEIDFSQLEVVMQAYITQDKQLIGDLHSGVDFHSKRLAYALDKTYEETKALVDNDTEYAMKRKKIAKPISFAKAYGAGAETIVENSGLDLAVVQKVLKAEDEEYNGVVKFYEEFANNLSTVRYPLPSKPQLVRDRITTGKEFYRTFPNENAAYYQWYTDYGQSFRIEESASWTRRDTIFRYAKPTTLRNYPVQGLAALIVSMQVGRVFRYLLKHKDKCLMINEVHDSLLVEIDNKHKESILKDIKIIMEDTSAWTRRFHLDWNVELRVDIKSGSNWSECK